ncbi:uncharacterized protein LOC127241902 [Andrographis paniculata]|uniref:uncharacterized protein LOC127241902 n=1 Tax=Andrographis paniculata TaxID=175694 RepID=UPI0021E97000|nr:uncharacterized protein LOC127241902 [Andrographis paniculata]
MAPLHLHLHKVLLFLLILTSTLISAHNPSPKSKFLLQSQQDDDNDEHQTQDQDQDQEHPLPSIKKKPISKNLTNPIKPTSNSDSNPKPTKLSPKKLNSTSNSNSNLKPTKPSPKKLNSTSNGVSLNPPKLSSPKNKTTTKKESKAQLQSEPNKPKSTPAQQRPNSPATGGDDEYDVVSDFRNLPVKFQESFLPDLEKITKSSKTYIARYNKEFAKGFKPYVGGKYAPAAASAVSLAFVVFPLILVSLIFNRIKAYFSLQRLLIFIQIYLAIYFATLCLSSVATGLEPLRFFYAAAKSTYVAVQVVQTLAYVLYLLLLLMYLVLVFSTETPLATKLLGLAQTLTGLLVGLHYYMTVFHRAVLRQPPKISWKAHGLYATCFFLICLLARVVDRRKKSYYLEDGGEEGKQS